MAVSDATCATASYDTQGQVLIPRGSAAKPGLAFISYPDTGIFDYGGGILGFSYGGSETFRVSGAAMSIGAAMLSAFE